jgi:hypothetical protein
LIWLGGPGLPLLSRQVEDFSSALATAMPAGNQRPFEELLKLAAAAAAGLLVTLVHAHFHSDAPLSRTLRQAQVLLCVSGALMMLLIGDSLARAFGIAGGASIVRFRTPVEDPKDSTVLFLLLGLGMSCGLGAFALAGWGTLFVCGMLAMLDRFGERKPRLMILELVAAGPEFPASHVHRVLSQVARAYEPRELSNSECAQARYHVTLDQGTSLACASSLLLADGRHGLKSISWEPPKAREAA